MCYSVRRVTRPEAPLERWAERIRAWRAGEEPEDAQRIAGKSTRLKSRDVYCYFDNDIKVKAPFDARRLIDKLGLGEGLVPFTWQK